MRAIFVKNREPWTDTLYIQMRFKEGLYAFNNRSLERVFDMLKYKGKYSPFNISDFTHPKFYSLNHLEIYDILWDGP